MRYYEDHIEHAFLDSARKKISEALSGRIRPHHKYYQRVSLGKDRKGKNKYRYFYTKDEWDTYNKIKANSKKAGSLLNRGVNIVNGYYSILLDDTTMWNTRRRTYLDIDTGGFLEHLLGISLVKVRKTNSKDDDDDNNDSSNLITPSDKSKSVDYIKFHHPKDPPKYIAKVKTDYGYRYFYNRNEYERYLQKNQPTKLSEFNRLSSDDSSFDGVIRNLGEINPHYRSEKNWQINCADCSLAYELRRRGYDVMADDNDDDYSKWAQNGNVTSVFPDAKSDYYDLTDASDYQEATDKLCSDMEKNYPDGARGVMSITWAGNNGSHEIAWEMVDGEPYFIDAQSGSVMSGSEFSKYMANIDYKESNPWKRWVTSTNSLDMAKTFAGSLGKSTSIMTTRLDNCNIKDTAASQVLPNSKNQNENHELESEAKANDPDNYEDPKPGHYSGNYGSYIDSDGNIWKLSYYRSTEDGESHYIWKNQDGDLYDPSGYFGDTYGVSGVRS